MQTDLVPDDLKAEVDEYGLSLTLQFHDGRYRYYGLFDQNDDPYSIQRVTITEEWRVFYDGKRHSSSGRHSYTDTLKALIVTIIMGERKRRQRTAKTSLIMVNPTGGTAYLITYHREGHWWTAKLMGRADVGRFIQALQDCRQYVTYIALDGAGKLRIEFRRKFPLPEMPGVDLLVGHA